MGKVYIVYGSSGEYSDRTEWAVAVVETEDDAKAYVAALDEQYKQIPQEMHEARWCHEDEMKAIMTLDPCFESDYTGTHYFYGEADFIPTRDLAAKIAA